MLYFHKHVEKLLELYPAVVDKDVGLGFMRGLRIKDSETLSSLVNLAFDEKVLVLKAGRNTLRFLPPLTITKEELDEGFKRVEVAFSKLS
jgi:acetylornithine aminotransferase